MLSIVRSRRFSVKRNKGFTIVEMLITMALVGILAAIALIATQRPLAKGRDTKRESDLNTVKLALEQHYLAQTTREFPEPNAGGAPADYVALGPIINNYLPVLPQDPLYPRQEYSYRVQSVDKQCFELSAVSETRSDDIYVCGGVYQCRITFCTLPDIIPLPTLTPGPTPTITPIPPTPTNTPIPPTPTNTPIPPTPTNTPIPPTPTNTPVPPTPTPFPTLTPTPMPVTIEIRVNQSSDDAEEDAAGNMDVTSSDLELVYGDASNQTVGMRFNNLTIASGATITNAYIQFQADETDSGATSLTIEGEDTDNALIFFNADYNISSRPRTTANVSWSPVPWTTVGEAGPDQRTPDITNIIQEIVNRPGWSSSNSLAIIITGTGVRTAESYNGVPSAAPLLHIELLIGPTPIPTTTPTPSITPTPTPAIYLFADSFESADFSAWDANNNDGGDLAATAGAKLVGNYGMSVNIDDTNNIWVEDRTPSNETRYRFRFYFDPNDLTMNSYGSHQIFTVFDNTTDRNLYVNLSGRRNFPGGYTISFSFDDNNDATQMSNWVNIGDYLHYVEIDYLASSSGYGSMWIDGVFAQTLTGNNSTRTVDYVRLGAAGSVEAATLGTYYVDDFASNNTGGVIGPAVPPPPMPWPFANSFETGNFAFWDDQTTDGTDLIATDEAAIIGSYGMEVIIDDDSNLWVENRTPSEETRYRARFYFDPNDLTMDSDPDHVIFVIYDYNDDFNLRVNLAGRRNFPGGYSIQFEFWDNNYSRQEGNWFNIGDYPHYLEIDYLAGSPGYASMWIDGIFAQTLSGNNSDRVVDYVRLGAVSSVDLSTSGSFYIDHFASNHTGAVIGPWSPPPPMPQPFTNSFETADLSQWDNNRTDGTDLSVTTNAAMVGVYGMSLNIDDAQRLWVEDTTPSEVSRYRLRFYLDPNSLSFNSDYDSHHIFMGYKYNGEYNFRLTLRGNGSGDDGYTLLTTLRGDDYTSINSDFHYISDGPHWIEMDYLAAASGYLSLWIDDVLVETTTRSGSNENLERVIDSVRLGAVDSVEADALGTYYIDHFASNHTGAVIGP